TTLHFCPAAGCPLGLPSVSAATVSPTSINIDSSGVLPSTSTFTATTANLDISATVTAIVQTQTGAASLILPASNSCVSGGACNAGTAPFAPGGSRPRC